MTIHFVEGLLTNGGHEVISVVVDKLSNYAHFILLKHSYTAKSVAKTFIDNVVKLNSFPKSIMTNRDRVCKSTY